MGATCEELRARFGRDGFALARRLVPRPAFEEAWRQAVPAAVAAGRYGGDPGELPGSLLHSSTIPEGLKEAQDLNLIHNGFLLLGFRALWPLLAAAAAGARCLLGLAPAGAPLAAGPESLGGLRLGAHLRLAPKVAGVVQQHIMSHQDAAYWAHKFQRTADLDAFANATVTAWLPLVDVGPRLGAMAYARGSHRRGFIGRGVRQKVPGLAERRLVHPELRSLDAHLAGLAEGQGVGADEAPLEEPPVVVPARQRDIIFHHFYTVHGPLPLPRNASRVRWIMEVRFHRAAVADHFANLADPSLVSTEKLMNGLELSNVDERSAYSEALNIVANVAQLLGPVYGNTRRAALIGSSKSGSLRLPSVGLGTGRLWPQQVAFATAQFLALGGRHIDTAVNYENHQAVVQACRSVKVPPQELVITTKIWPFGHKAVFDAIVAALRELDGLGQVVVLLHWPGAEPGADPVPPECRVEGRPHDWRRCRLESYLALLALRDAGAIAGCGVSNFTPRHLRQLHEDLLAAPRPGAGSAPWPPDVLQTEVHPWWREDSLLLVCEAWGTQVVAFGSLGSPERKEASLGDPRVVRIAKATKLTPGQVLLRWALQRGLLVIPTTASELHMREALAVASPEAQLDAEHMEELNRLPQWQARAYDPDPEVIE